MDVFALRNELLDDYKRYVQSFITIRDERIKDHVTTSLQEGFLWPDPLIQMNPAFQPGATIDTLVDEDVLHPECHHIFRVKRDQQDASGLPMRLYQHQEDAVRLARDGQAYVLTTGTGSGKSLAYIIPIVDHVLRRGPGQGIQAIVVYPMNALANSQAGELEKFLQHGYPAGHPPIRFKRYTGQEDADERNDIMFHPPDILLTNYVMLEYILTRVREKPLIGAARGLRFLVLDELHTYRGRQGADVALLLRRVRDQLEAPQVQIVGTSATLASQGSLADQKHAVARLASQIFGVPVTADHVIGETLRRVTSEPDLTHPATRATLAARIASTDAWPTTYDAYIADPLASWLESMFGVIQESPDGPLQRAKPRSVQSAASELARLLGQPVGRCARAIQDGLLAGYRCSPESPGGRPPFAFRLHQFISRGDAVYATLGAAKDRFITLQAQQFRPGHRDQILLPIVFCRECGQEYYSVTRHYDREAHAQVYQPRDLGDLETSDQLTPGFLYSNAEKPWPAEGDEQYLRLPEDWVEYDEKRGTLRLSASRKKDLPQLVRVTTGGVEQVAGEPFHFIGAPFRFCLHCGVAYDPTQKTDFPKLSTLSSEGRSTATTVLSLAVIRVLRTQGDLAPQAQKLLSFTDNRQDASLQAGHFNDFVEIGRLRGALYRAVAAAPEGLTHDTLTQRVFDALGLDLAEYAVDPGVKFQAKKETERALRDVLGYRLYRDLRRGWRITSPNLEQTGLLEVQYASLDEVCADEETWADKHPYLAGATPTIREKLAKTLLDHLRRELVIHVDFLEDQYLEQIQQRSNQHLIAPWALDENELRERPSVVFPRSRQPGDDRDMVAVSPRGGFGKYLRRPTTFGDGQPRLTMAEADRVIRDLLEALQVAGLVQVVVPKRKEADLPGYQIPASALRWVVGDGTRPYRDLIRMPALPDDPGHTNPFFVRYYREMAVALHGLTAKEHTAQVPSQEREDREAQFRAGKLPVLFCSPTMELGVDIAELNVVNMRNVPPTPANYAQRSGRAGRSGQPALVFTYCTTGSPHDQYFFRHQEDMVYGAVKPARLDLANEDLVRSHMHAIWLAETGQSLGSSLKDILAIAGADPTLTVLDTVRAAVTVPGISGRARRRCEAVLATIQTDLAAADWYTPTWLDDVLASTVRRFDETCDRWRDLYRAARKQQQVQHAIISDASRPQADKDIARQLRSQAESQIELLTEIDGASQSDFYSYRYFAAEGFLPGYSFPRLPLSAFIPARRGLRRDDYLSRPRFLAISEFGPRAFIYHEGARYLINRVILPIGDPQAETPRDKVALSQATLCGTCGYLHPLNDTQRPDLCQHCGAPLGTPLSQLFRMQNVSTRRRDRINSDEEERQRLGFDLKTGIRFATQGGVPSSRSAIVADGAGEPLVTLRYGNAATLWRINLGWRRRKKADHYGFGLDLERGYWSKENQASGGDESEDPISAASIVRVIPYVEDRRNCLLFEPALQLASGVMRSLMAALKSAIQVVYQLEDNELTGDLLPNRETARQILFFEAAEGGAGVLRRLLDEPDAIERVAGKALEICHFEPETGADRHRAPHAREDCEAACYDCLMSYYNQGDHQYLDRHAIQPVLRALQESQVRRSSGALTRSQLLADLKRLAGSTLELAWLDFLEARQLRLPTHAQVFIPPCQTRPDFLYADESQAAIYIDGPVHDDPARHQRDQVQEDAMVAAGYLVVRFGHQDDWVAIVASKPYIFGVGQLGKDGQA